MNKSKLIKQINQNKDELIKNNLSLKNQIDQVANKGIDFLIDLDDETFKKYLNDNELHHLIYNEDYFLIYNSDCDDFIKSISNMFLMSDLMNDLDDDAFKYLIEDKTKIFDSFRFVNMFAYIIGSTLLEYKQTNKTT